MDYTVIREQLKQMLDFIENTPSDKPHHDALWWGGQFPAYPDEYSPEDWQEGSYPIHVLWENYIGELIIATRYAKSPAAEALARYVEQARALPIADLLAASEQADQPD